MKINNQNSLIKCHRYATKKRDWLRWSANHTNRHGLAKKESFRMFMRGIKGNFYVNVAFFGAFPRMGAKRVIWQNS